MSEKKLQWIITGMQQDVSVSKFNPKYAYENYNIRLTAREDGTLMSITNEKGTAQHTITGIDDSTLLGDYLGNAIINNAIVIFTTTGITDYIYKLTYAVASNSFEGKVLFQGTLGFNSANPIEAIGIYENANIQKVYWIDGLNQPRVINIAATDTEISTFTSTTFDFAASIRLEEEITILKDPIASGNFAPGTVQYALSYFNSYGQETSIFYTSPLNYISFNDRGASPEDKVSNSFRITLSGADTSFDYVRIYSIHRTSIDATPTALKVADVKIVAGNAIYTDNGTAGSTIDPTILFYIGAETIIPKAIAHKDNTLFLGNIKLNRNVIPETVRNVINVNGTGGNVTFRQSNRKIYATPLNPRGSYPYANQLTKNSYDIKTFKYLDYYRMGVQFQHHSGKWSEVVWINDAYNTVKPLTTFLTGTHDDDPSEVSATKLVEAAYTFNDAASILALTNLGYVRARPVVCYPSISERTVVAQGILAPTVYNIADRFSNTPFVQSSWFARPNLGLDQTKSADDYLSFVSTDGNNGVRGINSPAGVWLNDKVDLGIIPPLSSNVIIDATTYGTWAEFRHNYPIPPNYTRNGELQNIKFSVNTPICPYLPTIDDTLLDAQRQSYATSKQEYFFIDQSIVTFHSPDIEFDDQVKALDTSHLKLRIVGQVPMTGVVSDIDIISSTPTLPFDNTTATTDTPPGFHKETIGVRSISRQGHRGLISGAFWFDEIAERGTDKNTGMYATAFMVYPWHRNGSLNNAGIPITGETRPSMLDKKKLSNLRFSFNSLYYNSVWNAHVNESTTQTGISGVGIFDSDQQSLLRIPKPLNSNLENLNYYGNVDKVLNITRDSVSYYTVNALNNIEEIAHTRNEGYDIIVTEAFETEDTHKLFSDNLIAVAQYKLAHSIGGGAVKGTEPIRMKYKSTPHAVIALNYTVDGKQRVLPTITANDGTEYSINSVNKDINSAVTIWKNGTVNVSQDAIPSALINLNGSDSALGYGFFWLAELYNDGVTDTTRFGGKTQQAFENNLWFPAGEAIALIDNGIPVNAVDLVYLEGDTFYQRYDHLKTYPYTLEDQNSVVDIVSFMCETRINIDGRYDRNRAQANNLTMTPTNFNKINPVYSQKNNFFNYRALNYEKFSIDYFPNSVTWSKSKTSGELVDTWTNITLASILDLDGDKGELQALKRFGNDIYAFQDTGISKILFNSRVQIPTSDGVPVEITNSYRVDGKVYLSETIGCQNKWSIVQTPEGLYFVDDYSNSIQLFNGGPLQNVTDNFGFRNFMSKNSFTNFKSFYDRNNNDVYYINDNYCLGYSELLKQFTSFYSYEGVPLSFNQGNKFFFYKDGKVWEQGAGHYNLFFNEIKPFYVTLIANPDEPDDKIFSTLNYRADTYQDDTYLPNTTFDTFAIWNEYQASIINLTNTFGKPSNLKKKFRSWNITIPRDSANKRDRIRNPWTFLKLEMKNPSIFKTQLHDVILNYFV